jgi:predicted PurR-regulated permease PerM
MTTSTDASDVAPADDDAPGDGAGRDQPDDAPRGAGGGRSPSAPPSATSSEPQADPAPDAPGTRADDRPVNEAASVPPDSATAQAGRARTRRSRAGHDDLPGVGNDRRWQPRLALTLALGVAAGFLLASLAGAVVSRIRGLLISVAVALFISFALEPAVKWMSDRGMSRGAATGLLFAGSAIAFVGFFAAMVPLIVDQTSTLVDTGPQVLGNISRQAEALPGSLGEQVPDWIDGLQEDLPNRLPALAGTAGRGVLTFGASVVGSLFNILTIALVAFYLAADGPKLRRVVSSTMQPSSQREFLEVWELAVEKTGGYLYSRLLTAVVSTVFHVVVFWLVGIDYAIALGVWVGVVSSVVPVVGTYLAGVLPVAIALSSSVGDALWVLGAIVAYQQVENYLIAPRITSHTVSLHPAVAFLAILAGASLLGAFGALLAIPAAAIVSALWSARRERHDVVDHDLIGPTITAPWLERRP